MYALHRHDLVWLDATVEAGGFALAAAQAEWLRNWVRLGRPLVVARQCEPNLDSRLLGFSMPPQRTRVGVRAPVAAVIRVSRPMLLSEAMPFAPEGWQSVMRRVQDLCDRSGVVVRVYGSLSTQAVSGVPYIDADSDLDLLLEVKRHTKLEELLAQLELFSKTPRLDGEITTPAGWSVAWRELAAALRSGTPCTVLAKSDCETRLYRIDDWLACLT